MDWVMGMQRAIDYVEAHITEDLDYDEIARQGYSTAYHFQRVFGLLCGYTLGEYIRNRRRAGFRRCEGHRHRPEIRLRQSRQLCQSIYPLPWRHALPGAQGGREAKLLLTAVPEIIIRRRLYHGVQDRGKAGTASYGI